MLKYPFKMKVDSRNDKALAVTTFLKQEMRQKMKRLAVIIAAFLIAGCASTQEQYLKTHSEISADQAQAIRGKALTHGLTKEQVLVSLGKPQKTHGYRKGDQLMELWIYSSFEWNPYENVLFQEGKVVGWNIPKSVKRELDSVSPEELLTATANEEETVQVPSVVK